MGGGGGGGGVGEECRFRGEQEVSFSPSGVSTE